MKAINKQDGAAPEGGCEVEEGRFSRVVFGILMMIGAIVWALATMTVVGWMGGVR